jgi:hypothetical protein
MLRNNRPLPRHVELALLATGFSDPQFAGERAGRVLRAYGEKANEPAVSVQDDLIEAAIPARIPSTERI